MIKLILIKDVFITGASHTIYIYHLDWLCIVLYLISHYVFNAFFVYTSFADIMTNGIVHVLSSSNFKSVCF